jgi:ubiquinone/menaquinone biosynthesis C-methylase UbiE
MKRKASFLSETLMGSTIWGLLAMERGYQLNYSSRGTAMHDLLVRERKARTMVAVLQDFFGHPLDSLSLLNVGGSTGIIDNYLARHFRSVIGVDIDAGAIEHAKQMYERENLTFEIGDAMALMYPDNSFDVAICSQVYEHVPDAGAMMKEIFRVLKPEGVCYFAANNRIMWNEPHYGLPLLSVVPRPLAHFYIRLARKAHYYHELHLTYWGLRRLVRKFTIHDYTRRILCAPEKYAAEYLVRPGTAKARIAVFIAQCLYWLMPGYVWILQKAPARVAQSGEGGCVARPPHTKGHE